eukprot:4835168-Amphidinium_carterae.1
MSRSILTWGRKRQMRQASMDSIVRIGARPVQVSDIGTAQTTAAHNYLVSFLSHRTCHRSNRASWVDRSTQLRAPHIHHDGGNPSRLVGAVALASHLPIL